MRDGFLFRGMLIPPGQITMVDIPPGFWERYRILLAEEFPAFQRSFSLPPVAGLRINLLKLSAAEFQAISPFTLAPIPWTSSGFVITSPASLVSPGKHPYHAAGLYYLQEPSAMAAAEILRPQPGEAVLDISAAPGGKATHIAALMHGEGLLLANEVHPQRVWELAANLERWGARHAVISNETPHNLAESLSGFFDRVLLDAPCSGEGMFRKSDSARRDWSIEVVRSCAVRQKAVISDAARLVKPGGVLVYSTCTFSPEENEGVLAWFLSQVRQEGMRYSLEKIDLPGGVDAARPEWAAFSGLADDRSSGLGSWDLRKAVRLWPHRLVGEGHFIAFLRREDAGSPSETQLRRLARKNTATLDRQEIKAFSDFCSQALQPELAAAFLEEVSRMAQKAERQSAFLRRGPQLYRLPRFPQGLSELKVIHPGWLLGSLRAGRFVPSHAMAMALRAGDVQLALDLQCDDPRLFAYLRGEMIEPDVQGGKKADWILVTVRGFPLGWGRRSQGVVKNYLPKGLRQFR